MSQNIPNKPSWMSDHEWAYVLKRDGRQCALMQSCRQNNGFAPCGSELDCDHRQPRAVGGDDSFANIRLMCSGPNRGRPTEADEYWCRRGWFDREFFPNKLRDIQLIAGYDQIVNQPLADALFNHPDKPGGRNALLKTTTLLPGATGIGKTMMTLGVLFGINEEVRKREPDPDAPSLPRVSRVLWLTPDTTLRDHTSVELAEEPLQFGLTASPPDVNIATSFAGLEKGPQNSDITVTCPQSLWEVDSRTKRETRTEDDVRRILEMWDTIVIDECDFANDQVKRLCRIASHALKFWMTASPMSDGGFLTDCVLISQDAVADYRRAQSGDQCLKHLAPTVVSLSSYTAREEYHSGERKEVEGSTGVGRDHTAFIAAIAGVAQEADNLERAMKRESPDEWYSPHIIVRLERIEEIKTLLPDLTTKLKEMKSSGTLKGAGWNVEAIYQGSKNIALGAKANGEYRHPFMLARNNNGQAVAKSARILLMAQIGVRGINNWPLKYVVDTTATVSLPELIQFNIGRPIRWPWHLAHWIKDETKGLFTTTTVVCLSDLLEKKQKAYADAHNFVMEQRELLADAGFNTWNDICNGHVTHDEEIVIVPSDTPFTDSDRTDIKVGLGEAIGQGVDVKEPAAICNIVDRLFPPAEGKRRERAKEYANDLVTDPGFREREVPSGTSADVSAIGVVAKLKPQDVYDTETLVRFVQWEDSYAELRLDYIQDIKDGRRTVVNSVTDHLKRINEHNYRELPKSEALSAVFKELTNELLNKELNPRGPGGKPRFMAMPSNDYGAVARAVRNSAYALFGMRDAGVDNGPMDKRPYHVAMKVRYRRQIKDMAVARLVSQGLIPAYSNLRNL